MFCPGCGTENDDRNRNCKFCGRDLHPVPDPTYGDQEQASPPPQPTFSTGPGGPPPGMGGYSGAAPRIPTYLVPSILTTLFCCLPAGVVGIIYAAQVNGKLARGDVAGAASASRRAKTWCWVSFGLGITLVVITMATGSGTTNS